MPGFFDWVSSGISTAVQPFTNWLSDSRSGDLTRPRATALDPTQAIDGQDSMGLLSFPHDRPKYYMTFAFEEYERPTQFQGLQSKGLTDYICLPLPNNMKDMNSINYSTQPGHILAEAIGLAHNNGAPQDIDNALKTGSVDGIIKNVGDAVSGTGQGVGGWSVKKALSGVRSAESLLGENGATDSVLQVAGLADNPFMTVALKGPNFKRHHFIWKLAPKNSDETNTVNQIVGTFKKMMYPELLNLGVGGFFKYPHIVWPKFQPDAVISNTYAFKPCVITNFNVNHTPNDRPGLYADTSAPVEVDIEIGLLEIELWRGGDDNPTGISQGNFPSIPGDFSNVQTPPGRNLGNI